MEEVIKPLGDRRCANGLLSVRNVVRESHKILTPTVALSLAVRSPSPTGHLVDPFDDVEVELLLLRKGSQDRRLSRTRRPTENKEPL